MKNNYNITEIMEQIKNKVAQQKENLVANTLNDLRVDRVHSSNTYQNYEKMEYYDILPQKDSYHAEEILHFNDEEFIYNAYLAILNRKPEQEAVDYYNSLLRSHQQNKIEIMWNISKSEEALRVKKEIIGLDSLYKKNRIKKIFFDKIPGIRYIFKWFYYLIKLPKFVRYVELSKVENYQKTFNLIKKQQNTSNILLNNFNVVKNSLEDSERKNKEMQEYINSLNHIVIVDIMDKLNMLEKNTPLTEVKDKIKDFENQIEDKFTDYQDRFDSIEHYFVEYQDKFQIFEASAEDKINTVNQHFINKIEEINSNFVEKSLLGVHEQELASIQYQIKNLKMNILDQQRRVTLLLEEARKRLPEPINTDQIINMLTEEDHLLDAMYVSFEDRFRGTREDIQNRQKYYLKYFEDTNIDYTNYPILDIGCGRGEWLELLKNNGLNSIGIDLNKIMVQESTSRGLDVVNDDAINFLSKKPANSIGAITGFHIVEHLPYKTLVRLFDEALRVLVPGGMIIFETPNPENIIVGACNFYMDPTHRNPLPPMFLHFIAEERGFVRPDIVKLHPYNFTTGNQFINNELLDLVNKEQDYSIIAYKA